MGVAQPREAGALKAERWQVQRPCYRGGVRRRGGHRAGHMELVAHGKTCLDSKSNGDALKGLSGEGHDQICSL